MKIYEDMRTQHNTAALPSFSEFIGDYGWVPSLVDERASTFLRAAIMHNWDRLCSWICPQDTNFALLPYQPYQLISVPSLKLRSTPDHWGYVTILYYSCSRQADVQEAVRAAQVRTTGNAFAT